MLREFEIKANGHGGGSPSETDFMVEQSKRARKASQKKKDGTDGINLVDERKDSDRWDDYKDMYKDMIGEED